MGIGYVLYSAPAPQCPPVDAPVKYIALSDITRYDVFLPGLDADDFLILLGSNTLHRFLNCAAGIDYSNEVYYSSEGTGLIPITARLKAPPRVTVNGKSFPFLTCILGGSGVRFWELPAEYPAHPGKSFPVFLQTVQALLSCHPTVATVTVDGTVHPYQKVWAVLIRQDAGVLSTLVLHSTSRVKALALLSALRREQPCPQKKWLDTLPGRESAVTFGVPVSVVLGGETVSQVTSYTAVEGKTE